MPREAGRALKLVGTADAFALLANVGASPWLVRHHELVVETAEALCDRIGRELRVMFDRRRILLGAALHDVGKVVHPNEMSAPGHEHEAAGEQLLLERGVEAEVAREDSLEKRVVEVIAEATRQERWSVFDVFDAICEAVASAGPERLTRSNVHR